MITKTDFLTYVEAPRHFWALRNNRYDLTLSDFDQHLIEQGYIVEEKAKEYAKRYLMPKYSIDEDDLSFQQTCIDGEFEARSDILIRNSKTNKWDLYEVKSVTKPKSEHYYDATFQTIIFEKHFDIENVFILHVDNDYRRNGDFDLSSFMKVENVNEKVNELRDETLTMMSKCLSLARVDNYKQAKECWKPKECRCKDLCFPNLPDDSIYNLSRVTERKINDLLDYGIVDITDVPDDYALTTNQRVQVKVAKRNKTLIDEKAIKRELESLEYPLYFLDYETYDSAIPLYDGYKPYQHMVFQYSLHVLDKPEDKELKHYEYVVNNQDEPSKELLNHLKEHIGENGSVIVWYRSFECTRNKEMAEICPEFADFLESVNSRVFDLMDIFKNNYYVDPLFRGSNSIKDVLPVLVPKLSYKDINIQGGTMAMTAWHKLVYEDTSTEEKEALLQDLLTYCELDTLAMVKIWEYLRHLSS